VHPTGALDPGLVYDAGEDDYLRFLCNYGYNASTVRLIAGSTLPGGFSCAANASKDLISDLNYPSIAVSGLLGNKGSRTVTVTRAVTNVGAQEAATYTVAVTAPARLIVTVTPSKLEFTRSVKKMAFQVTFSHSGNDDNDDDDAAAKGALSGSITWSDGKHFVRSPFVVTS
jgi:hypothetical protein